MNFAWMEIRNKTVVQLMIRDISGVRNETPIAKQKANTVYHNDSKHSKQKTFAPTSLALFVAAGPKNVAAGHT